MSNKSLEEQIVHRLESKLRGYRIVDELVPNKPESRAITFLKRLRNPMYSPPSIYWWEGMDIIDAKGVEEIISNIMMDICPQPPIKISVDIDGSMVNVSCYPIGNGTVAG